MDEQPLVNPTVENTKNDAFGSESAEDRIHLRSEEVQEILSTPPKWIIRYGIGSILCIILLLFVGSYFFKYPDIVEAPIEISTRNIPLDLIAKTDGKLVRIFVHEGDTILKGQALALIESGLQWSDFLMIQSLLDSLRPSLGTERVATHIDFPSQVQLGELQIAYIAFLKAYNEYVQYVSHHFIQGKIRSLEHQIQLQRKVLQKAGTQAVLSQKQLQANTELYRIDSSLWCKNALSLSQFKQSENTYIQALSAYENIQSGVEQIHLEIARLEQSLAETKQQAFEQNQQLYTALTGAYESLGAELSRWRQTYLFESPIEGRITFAQIRQENQHILNGEVFLTVVPQGKVELYGKILLPMQGSGKVKKGQSVNIKVDAYPHMEYGMVKGIIENISLVPDESNKESKAYKVDLSFPDGLQTYYGKKLVFFQKMQGQAEIITEDLRLLDKFLNPIRAVLKRG